MKLALIFNAAPVSVCATKMEPRVRLFSSEEEALAWERSMASRRGLKQLFLSDNRKPAGG
jgi:hypothetical protein